jgi:hypothetical protein
VPFPEYPCQVSPFELKTVGARSAVPAKGRQVACQRPARRLRGTDAGPVCPRLVALEPVGSGSMRRLPRRRVAHPGSPDRNARLSLLPTPSGETHAGPEFIGVSEGQPSFGQGGCRSVAGVQPGVEDTDRIIETVPVPDGNERLTAADSAGARRGRRGQRRQAAPQTVSVELRRIAVCARGRCFLELPRGCYQGPVARG